MRGGFFYTCSKKEVFGADSGGIGSFVIAGSIYPELSSTLLNGCKQAVKQERMRNFAMPFRE
jgi:hypothetical protein